MNPFKAAYRYWHMRASWLGDGGDPAPNLLANYRASICARCPLNNPNRPIWEIVTGIASAELRRQIELKGELKLSTRYDGLLHVCNACDCFLPLKVWVPLSRVLETTDLSTLHPSDPTCWILAEKASQTK